ncbi:MAG: DoxX family protein [Bacteroidales bacterium]|nr:DoxX family protein [Bacteroidales bacterium]
MNAVYKKYKQIVVLMADFPLLFFRLILAYGFYEPMVLKWKNITSTAEWFSSMHYPFPLISFYIAGITEFLGVILLLLGLGTRVISIPLLFVMLIAIITVHLENGFAAGDNGFEIPLYYMLMLFALVVYGSGKFSIDNLIAKK